MKKIPILFLLLAMAGAPLAHADIIPPGQKVVPVCAKISNLAAYPKLTLVMVTIQENGQRTPTILGADTCVSSTGKYEDYKVFAVDATEYTSNKSGAAYDFFRDPNAYPVSGIEAYDEYLQDTDNTTSINRYYDLEGVDNRTKTVPATLVKQQTNLKTDTFTPEAAAGLLDHITLDSPAFADVDSSSPYYAALSYLRKMGLVNGYDDNTFKPDNPVNRAEFLKMLFAYQMGDNYTAECDPNLFKDVINSGDAQLWYFKYLCFAYEAHFVSGYPDGTFKPAQNIVFSEAAKIISNGSYLTDENSTSDPWYKVYVDALSGVNAIPLTVTAFDHQVTRGEMAEMMYRLTEKVTELPSMTFSGIR